MVFGKKIQQSLVEAKQGYFQGANRLIGYAYRGRGKCGVLPTPELAAKGIMPSEQKIF